MDPTSFAASVVALLTAAGASCDFIYNFILDISELPEEIHMQAIKLKCLEGSISDLLLFYEQNQALAEIHMDPFLKNHLSKFRDDTELIEKKIKKRSTRLDQGRAWHIRERLLWISSNRRMRKFSSSLDDWMTILSIATMKTKLALLVKIEQRTEKIHTSLTATEPGSLVTHEFPSRPKHESIAQEMHHLPHIPNIPGGNIVMPMQSGSFPKSFLVQNTNRIEPAGANVLRWITIFSSLWSLHLQFGSAMTKTSSEQGKSIYKTLSWMEGICFVSTFQLHRLLPRRFTLVLTGIAQLPTMAFSCNMSIKCILDTSDIPYRACLKGDWPLLRELIRSKKVGLTDCTPYGSTLLHIAARSNHYDMVVGLLQEGAFVDVENDFGETPLQEAVRCDCNYNVLDRLVSAGADLLHQDRFGKTPLHVYFNSAFRTLIEFHCSEIESTSQDNRGRTLAHYVAHTNSSQHVDLMRCVNGDTAPMKIADEEGRIPLHLACKRGNLDVIHYLLSRKNVDVSIRDYQGRSLLHYAAESRRGVQVIERLLQHGIGLQAVDIHGRTAMHHAASEGNLAVVQKLIEVGTGSQLSMRDDTLKTPLDLASINRQTAVVEYLRSVVGEELQSIVWKDDTMDDLIPVEKRSTIIGLSLLSWAAFSLIILAIIGSRFS